MSIRLTGDLYTGGRSARQPAELSFTESGLVSVDVADFDTGHLCCQFNELEISSRLGSTPRHIHFVDGSHFETIDNDTIDTLQKNFSRAASYRFIHYLESHALFVLLSVVLVSGFIWGSVKFGIPAIASFTAKTLPVEVSQYLGQGSLQILDKTFFTASKLSLQRQQELTDIFERYSAEFLNLNVKVNFRYGDKVGANAMALPDGNIIFTDELIDLAKNDLELVAIFAHEVGHLAHRHMLRRIVQDSMLTVLLVMVTGDVSSASSVVYTVPGLLLELAYSREFESEADDFAVEFLHDQKIETQYFADIMLRLTESQNQQGKTNDAELTDVDKPEQDTKVIGAMSPYLSTHPATQNRIQKFIIQPQGGD